ncbi:NAD(P)-binding protein [Cylindrobasidium torrendii FP15055 ss-10]|uniref:NAD(P)-binding protein n=1 Tax=Cylindrobasidium torrendii FP15055 ss-10 TaxID=1314674 RepID=A0A0D7BTU2_9AGAR|nr:NAD(P)-binding protein [Cylindrobasidium torrendii FP15055 ss-10]
MKAFYVEKLAHPNDIPISLNAPTPIPKEGEVLVDVYSAGLNFFDILQCQGKYQKRPALPFVAGTEFAGRVSRNSPIPPGCPFKRGDRVFGATQGAFAEVVAVPCLTLLPLPDVVSFKDGGGLYVTWPTSYEALVGRGQLQAGEWVLVTAAAGGVGVAAVQIAKALGAKVIAAAGSDEKVDIAMRYGGADYGINYANPGWPKEVMKLTGGKGVDVVYDAVGLVKDSLKCVAWKARILVVGFASGTIDQVPMNIVLLKNISVVGLHWGGYEKSEPARIAVVWKELLDMLATGKIKPVNYTQHFTLDTIKDGLAALETRKTWGKAIMEVRKEFEAAL